MRALSCFSTSGTLTSLGGPSILHEARLPGYDGEQVPAAYGYWRAVPGMTEQKVRKAHAAYCGEVTPVDTWLGYLLGIVEKMELMDNTVIIFTSDHGFYYSEHGFLGNMNLAKGPDATPELFIHTAGPWNCSLLYEKVAPIPLLIYVPGVGPGAYRPLTGAVDLIPIVLYLMDTQIPPGVEVRSLLPRFRTLRRRDFTATLYPSPIRQTRYAPWATYAVTCSSSQSPLSRPTSDPSSTRQRETPSFTAWRQIHSNRATS